MRSNTLHKMSSLRMKSDAVSTKYKDGTDGREETTDASQRGKQVIQRNRLGSRLKSRSSKVLEPEGLIPIAQWRSEALRAKPWVTSQNKYRP
jgi:hypothetical protein